ncbi:MAG: biotin--[acetyl-CoA-carboxylase] ligase [Bacteroidaceae bacterium]|nr:biotin--[acetyl-CoA-carboxylase] ligase [Bacteroidaceae bacterium]
MIELDRIDSTNSFLRHYRPPTPRRIVLATAEFQTAGRGAGSNAWESAEGENLLFSLLTHPTMVMATDMFMLSEALALSVSDALNDHHPGTSIKWPNDIYYGDCKVAGMLIENELSGRQVDQCVMGVGLNVNQTIFRSDAPNPTSLALLTGQATERRFVLESVVQHFTHYYKMVEQGQYTDLHAAYLQRLYRKGKEHRYRDAGGEFSATLTTVEPTGHLLLTLSDGTQRRYAFKEVEFIVNTTK